MLIFKARTQILNTFQSECITITTIFSKVMDVVQNISKTQEYLCKISISIVFNENSCPMDVV